MRRCASGSDRLVVPMLCTFALEACVSAVKFKAKRAADDFFLNAHATIVYTRRVPVQRAVELDEIPYPYPYPYTTLRPLLNITIKSTIVVRNRSRSCGGGDICGTTPASRSHVNIATVAMRNYF